MTIEPIRSAIASTPTAQQRRVSIPKHRREAQVKQTILGIVVGAAGMGLVYLIGRLVPNGVTAVWYLVVILLGARVANKEFVVDSIKMVKELLKS